MPVGYQSWGIQKSNYKCYIWTVSFHHEQHPCAFSNVKFDHKYKCSYHKFYTFMTCFLYEQQPCVSSKTELQMLHLYGFFPLWAATFCFFKSEIWSQMFLSKILHFMTVSLYEQCFFKNWITNFTLVQFLSFITQFKVGFPIRKKV